jgi:hypothetical protein
MYEIGKGKWSAYDGRGRGRECIQKFFFISLVRQINLYMRGVLLYYATAITAISLNKLVEMHVKKLEVFFLFLIPVFTKIFAVRFLDAISFAQSKRNMSSNRNDL